MSAKVSHLDRTSKHNFLSTIVCCVAKELVAGDGMVLAENLRSEEPRSTAVIAAIYSHAIAADSVAFAPPVRESDRLCLSCLFCCWHTRYCCCASHAGAVVVAVAVPKSSRRSWAKLPLQPLDPSDCPAREVLDRLTKESVRKVYP